MTRDYLWKYHVVLTCGHRVDFGTIPGLEIERVTPRRKDRSFAALRCPEHCGRRRIVASSSFSTGVPA